MEPKSMVNEEAAKKLVHLYLHQNANAPIFLRERYFARDDVPTKGDYITLDERLPEGPENTAQVVGVIRDTRRPTHLYLAATEEVFEDVRRLTQAPQKKG